MAKREISSTLKNLKFMQRASTHREEKTKKAEEDLPDGNFPSSSAPKRCVVIMEGDPHPGARKGRMSFQNFNPAIDKINEAELKPSQSEASETSSATSEIISNRENGFSQDGPENLKLNNSSTDAKGEHKRKQDDTVSDVHFPNKTHKNQHGYEVPSSSGNKKSQKQPKSEKLDWSVLRPPKYQNKKH